MRQEEVPNGPVIEQFEKKITTRFIVCRFFAPFIRLKPPVLQRFKHLPKLPRRLNVDVLNRYAIRYYAIFSKSRIL
jgi:hypothetical protein